MKKLKIREEFVREAYNSACSTWKQKIENEFPELFKKELEVGKWYKDDGILFCFQGKYSRYGDSGAFGFTKSGLWHENLGVDLKDGLSNYFLATEEEVKTALVAELKRRYKTGQRVKCVKDENDVATFDSEHHIDFYFKDNDMYISGVCIYKKGKWAEIVVDTELEQMKQQLKDLAKKFEEYEKRN